ncbi:MAG: hypothetical protein HC869_16500 [Rhodospirillales bacterium]|nr:hypothetical protein [Rhodospirillales bacterium]
MKALLVAVAFAFTSAPAVPALAQVKEPKTKAECEKTKDMKWDAKTNKCMKK